MHSARLNQSATKAGGVLVCLLIGAVILVVNAPRASGQGTSGGAGTVVVVHGLVDFPADVYLDGSNTPALTGFEFRRVTDPLSLPAGVHRADLRRAGEPATTPPSLSGTFTVTSEQRVTVAALLDPDAKPAWVAFPNDANAIDTNRGEVRFRHFASTPAVSVLVDGEPVLANVTNLARAGQAAPLRLTPGTHDLSVQDSSSGAVLVAPTPIAVPAGVPMNIYLTGRAAGTGSAGLALLQEIPAPAPSAAAQRVPAEIPGGNSGLAATEVSRESGPPSEANTQRWVVPGVISVLIVALLAAACVMVLGSLAGTTGPGRSDGHGSMSIRSLSHGVPRDEERLQDA